jgi:hypothetical protein
MENRSIFQKTCGKSTRCGGDYLCQRSLNQLVWRILFQATTKQLDKEETHLRNDSKVFQFFQESYNIAYLLSVVNRRKLQDCRQEPMPNRYLPNLEEDSYLAYKRYLGRERAKETRRNSIGKFL